MRSLERRRRLVAVLATALFVATAGAAWGTPQSDGNPNVTLDLSPNDGQNLPSPANLTVTGAGFGSGVSGDFLQCTSSVAEGDICGPLGRWTSTAAGSFTGTVQVSQTFSGLNAANQQVVVNCNVTPCAVKAVSDSGQYFSAHTISFATGGTTTSSSTSSSTSTTTSTSTSTTSTSVPPTTTTTANPLTCNGRAATIVGTDGSDSLVGTAGADVIVGRGGDDQISGLGGDDVICGGDGNDRLLGGDGNDTLLGGAGSDDLAGGSGNDVLKGEAGTDRLVGESGTDTCTVDGVDLRVTCEA